MSALVSRTHTRWRWAIGDILLTGWDDYDNLRQKKTSNCHEVGKMGLFLIAGVMGSGFIITIGILLYDEWTASRRPSRNS
jgi:hypothetical protein